MFVPWMFPKTRWLMRFVAKLSELKPELTPAATMMIAFEAFNESDDVDPAEAAEMYFNEQEYLERVRKVAGELVEFYSNRRRPDRELWVARTFLERIGVSFKETELVHVKDDPPDVRFRDARFEVKVIPEARPHGKAKERHKRALEAKRAADLLEPYIASDITYTEVVSLVEARALPLREKYPAAVRRRLDLLVYISLLDTRAFIKRPLPSLVDLAATGFRSVSVLFGLHAIVLVARDDAPSFLKDVAAHAVA